MNMRTVDHAIGPKLHHTGGRFPRAKSKRGSLGLRRVTVLAAHRSGRTQRRNRGAQEPASRETRGAKMWVLLVHSESRSGA